MALALVCRSLCVSDSFAVRLCYGMTMNKAQSQTLDYIYVRLYLPRPILSHGQLYVG